MEDIIFFAVVAISIIISIVKNYKQEAKKNSKRVITTPQNRAGKPSTISTPPQHTETFETLETLETLENTKSSVLSYSTLKINKVNDTDEVFHIDEHDYNQNDEIKNIEENDDQFIYNNVFINSKDELKKAVVYSTILERKY